MTKRPTTVIASKNDSLFETTNLTPHFIMSSLAFIIHNLEFGDCKIRDNIVFVSINWFHKIQLLSIGLTTITISISNNCKLV